MITRRYHLLLIAIVVLAAYYPAISADFSRYDDAALADSYRQVQGWNLKGLFLPFSGEAFYYRPLIGVSFLFDKHVLGLSPNLMHLENILIHIFNTILVYFLASQILSILSLKKKTNHPAFHCWQLSYSACIL